MDKWGWLIVAGLIYLYLQRQPMHNEEIWRWTDWEGKPQSFTITRNVKHG